jgi:hypothetical protein
MHSQIIDVLFVGWPPPMHLTLDSGSYGCFLR